MVKAEPSAVPLQIAEGLDVVVISDNEILVQFGSRSHPSRLFRDTDLTGALGEIFGRLQDGPASRDDLLAQVAESGADAVALLDGLCERGILVPTDTDLVAQYLGYTFSGTTQLKDFQVGQIGAGPVGAYVAEILLQHGIGRLRLADDREADASWSRFVGKPGGRSHQFTEVGLRDRLAKLGYDGVEAGQAGSFDDSLLALVHESDLVILTLERPDVRLAHLVNRVALTTDTPWIAACLDGNFGVAGPMFAPGITACYNDYRALADAATPSPMMARAYRRHRPAPAGHSFFPGLPAYAASLAGFVSVAATQMLLSSSSFLLGRTLTVNFDAMIIDVEDVLRLPRCPVCRPYRSAAQTPFPAEAVSRGRASAR